ncbi:acetyl esterase [Dactylonectria estremocensis]|uniref:Acetyl esterase n=1 Tax=Dactylonectria estremocensis TaxID=1079267 RepID=A0A9P9IW00_9HYPO|nr:acetyl esterase [Dactylonectria estremocensis]
MSAPSRTGGELRKLENLISFGDSWTDSGRIDSFIKTKGIPPAVGVLVPDNKRTASGGLAWGQFVAKSTGAKYFNYACSGATVSNDIVQCYFDLIRQPFPSVLDYQIPAYQADLASGTLFDNRNPNNTLYTLWVGTNDLGEHGMLTDGNATGTTLTTFVEGVWTVFDRIYATGGRHFVLFNLAPLELAPLYKASFINPTKTASDPVQVEKKMRQYTSSVNTMFDYGLPFQLLVRERWPGSTVAIFDTNTLLRDIFMEPKKYFEAPADVEGIYNVWDPVTGVDTPSALPLNSFMWYDPVHPSERTLEVVASEFVEVVRGKSKYGTFYTS